MKIAILLKHGPDTPEAARALQTAADMLALEHEVSLYLLQEAVRFCSAGAQSRASAGLRPLMDKNLRVHALTQDAELRGIQVSAAAPAISGGSYDSLVELMESCDRVIGVL